MRFGFAVTESGCPRTPGAIVENKWLGAVLAAIQASQAVRTRRDSPP